SATSTAPGGASSSVRGGRRTAAAGRSSSSSRTDRRLIGRPRLSTAPHPDRWRVVFMGTPAFARTILEALLTRADPAVGVVCQPDRRRGRGLALAAPETKQLAMDAGLPVLQPERLRDPGFMDAGRALAPDLIVVAAYGKI